MIPEAKPESIDNAKPGLVTISLKIVSPAETDVYTFRKNDMPRKNNENIAIINPTDHLPNLVFGRSLIFSIKNFNYLCPPRLGGEFILKLNLLDILIYKHFSLL